jgi:putative SbcD/Mre11-related phosphoesterase
MTNRTQLELEPGLVLDARRALWLARERTLVVADLHLGYAWTHRHAGQLLPLAPDDTLARLEALVNDFAPEELVLLGDVVHGFTPSEEVLAEIRHLASGIGSRVRLRLVEGNHDFALKKMLRRLGLDLAVELQIFVGPHVLLHGHTPDDLKAAALIAASGERGGRVILGHEHPAVRLSDGVASSARCPCFIVGEGTLVLPCFTEWSAGGNAGPSWLSALGKGMKVQRRIAIVAGKLLSLPAA